jgi:hypothetical protein
MEFGLSSPGLRRKRFSALPKPALGYFYFRENSTCVDRLRTFKKMPGDGTRCFHGPDSNIANGKVEPLADFPLRSSILSVFICANLWPFSIFGFPISG